VALIIAENALPSPVPSRVVYGRFTRTARWADKHRWAAATIVALVVSFGFRGLPADPVLAGFFIFLVLFVDGLATRGVAGTLAIARDWVPVIGILVFYDMTRSVADDLGMPLQVDALVRSEEFLFAGHLPTVWLQEHLLGTKTAWWEVVLAVTYVSHFAVSFVLLGVLYARSRRRWLAYLRRFVTLNVAGMITYIVVPAAPPWWASDHGNVEETIGRTLNRGWDAVGLRTIGNFIRQGQGGANDVAALPSLHAGYACMVAIVLWSGARASRPVLAAYPLLMGFALVIGGEHYVVDLILGAIYAGVIHLGWSRWERRRAQRDAREPDTALVA